MSEVVDTAMISSEMCCKDALLQLLQVLEKQLADVERDIQRYHDRRLDLIHERNDLRQRIAHTEDLIEAEG